MVYVPWYTCSHRLVSRDWTLPTTFVTQPAYRSDVKFSVSLYQVAIHRIPYFIIELRRETRFALPCVCIEYTWEGFISNVTLIACRSYRIYLMYLIQNYMYFEIKVCLLTSLVCLLTLQCSSSVWHAFFRDKWQCT
jgi:hypothetical protein